MPAPQTSIATHLARGGEQLKMAVSPAYAFAPALLRVRITMERNAENRSLEVIADSGGFYRSSDIQLEGERSAATLAIDSRNVPEGNYRLVGILKDGAGRQRSIVSQDVTVIGVGIGG